MAQQPYHYKPLDSKSNSIRLVTLWPGKWEDDIVCSIHHADLDKKPSYRALSYTWGGTTDTKQLLLEGRTLQVTRNLEIALRHLRQLYACATPQVLWIDAICINQSDLVERSEQVRKMEQIFTSARQILAWTGEADEDSKDVLSILDTVSKISKSGRRALSHNSHLRERVLLEDGRPLEILPHHWHAFDRFQTRSYWSRAWILPELSAQFYPPASPANSDHRCLIIDGLNTFSFEQFKVACHVWLSETVDRAYKGAEYPNDIAGVEMYVMARNASKRTLSKSLLAGLGLQCSDPRDRVYAMLALAISKDQDFDVDYTKPVDQVYIDAIRSCISREGSLYILEGNSASSGKSEQFPSWMNQFKSPGFRSSASPDVQADGGLPPSVRFHMHRRWLTIDGLLVGTVQEIFGPFRIKPLASGPEARTYSLDSPARDCFYDDNNVRLSTLAAKLTRKQQDEICNMVTHRGFGGRQNLSGNSPALNKLHLVRNWLGFDPDIKDIRWRDEIHSSLVAKLVRSILESLNRHRLFVLDSGQVGLTSGHVQRGNAVAILYGGKHCFVLHPSGSEYRMHGSVYVEGVMKGELTKDLDQDGKPKETRQFVIC